MAGSRSAASRLARGVPDPGGLSRTRRPGSDRASQEPPQPHRANPAATGSGVLYQFSGRPRRLACRPQMPPALPIRRSRPPSPPRPHRCWLRRAPRRPSCRTCTLAVCLLALPAPDPVPPPATSPMSPRSACRRPATRPANGVPAGKNPRPDHDRRALRTRGDRSPAGGWLPPGHPDATAGPDRRRAATCQASTGRTASHRVACLDAGARRHDAADPVGKGHA